MSETPRWYLGHVPDGVPIDRANQFELSDDRSFVHGYGDNVFIHSPHPLIAALAAKISYVGTVQPEYNNLMRQIYTFLMVEAIRGFPRRTVAVHTPMEEAVGPRGIWVGDIADPKSKVVIADIVRAGSVPAETVYGQLTTVIDPENVRKDVIVMARQVGQDGRVTGTEHGYSKIDGSIQGSILLIPEPMVATGGTIDKLFQVYAEMDAGEPSMAILMAMIVTPEALRLLTDKYPKLRIHAARLDRGMSDQDILSFMPGMYRDREFGLTDTDYIAPGGGGVGERTNNTKK